jgi:hypothetical protein
MQWCCFVPSCKVPGSTQTWPKISQSPQAYSKLFGLVWASNATARISIDIIHHLTTRRLALTASHSSLVWGSLLLPPNTYLAQWAHAQVAICGTALSLRTLLDNNITYDEGEKGPQVLALEELAGQSFAAAHHLSWFFIQFRTRNELIQIDSVLPNS